MIEATIAIVLVIIWFMGCMCALTGSVTPSGDTQPDTVRWACGIVCILSLGWVLSKVVENEQKYPCIEYEAQMMYNAATKSMMPMRVCVRRGEWMPEEPRP